MHTEQLLNVIRQNIATTGRAVLVIDGDCAAGKTTLAAHLAGQLDCNVFHMDDFFLPPELRTKERLSEAGGNIHYERFLAQVLQPLIKNEAFSYGAYSCTTQKMTDVTVKQKPAVIIEGSYSLHPRFLDAYKTMGATMLFIQISKQQQRKRIRNRNGEAMLRRFQEEWIPMEKRYHKAFLDQWDDVQFIDA